MTNNTIVGTTYNPHDIEESIYKFWETENYFDPTNNIAQNNYCIMMPPPNITGQLHLGHAFQQTIMDILIRYHRMQGNNTLWQTGLDHAGIATQILIENKNYINTGKTKSEYDRDEFIKSIWKWKEESEKIITYQMKRLGNSICWKYKRFTMDSDMSYSVREAFIRLYQDNLIYRGKKLVNWDFKLKTAISDLEVENKPIKGYMWYIRYPLDFTNLIDNNTPINNNTQHYLTVATTRPETIFGDTAIAVHPEDSRYQKFIGKFAITPITNRRIPIIADKYVDIMKATGCVKITPAHDFNDYTIGQRHNLPMINIFSHNRTILKIPEVFDHTGNKQHDIQNIYHIPKIFHNLNWYSARNKIISECKRLNLLSDIKKHNLTIPYNYRTGSIIEPMLTDQWYVRTKHLAKQAIEIVKQNSINFIPKQYKKMYFSWMNNIQDWCISRQIWWGHKIPAWYDSNNQIYVGHSENDIRTQNQLNNDIILHQDNDVLDTWFSSSLWTFSSLGWPKSTDLLKKFHPTNVIVSGFDIIFFWIARMIMFTMYFIKDKHKNPQVPFKTAYITGLIRDEFGQKMSKSQGNTIDPLDMIDGIAIENLIKKRTEDNMHKPKFIHQIIQYTKKQFPNGIKPHGADAVRFTLAALSSSGRDIHWDMKRLTGYYNFCNKLWNASKFVLIHTNNQDCGIHIKEQSLSLSDRWIISKFYLTVKTFRQQLELYRFDQAINILYEFIWHQFCDWYIELIKPILYNNDPLASRSTRNTLITLLELILRLAHPIIPFITEKIWQEIKTILRFDCYKKTIMFQPFPEYDKSKIDSTAIIDLEWIKQIIIEIRTLRSNLNINYNTPLEVFFKNISSNAKNRIINNYNLLVNMARLKNINFDCIHKNYIHSNPVILNEAELFILLPPNNKSNLL